MCYYNDMPRNTEVIEHAESSLVTISHTVVTTNPAGDLVPYQPTETLSSSDEGVFCSCVRSARYLGVNVPLIDAIDLQPNGPPQVGGVVLLNYLNSDGEVVGHMAKIEGLLPKGMAIREGNKKRCLETSRFIFYSDPAIRGFWHENNI